ncbi:MAG: lysophospholipid acyltransferase family protein [Gemmatimonadota bacterium]
MPLIGRRLISAYVWVAWTILVIIWTPLVFATFLLTFWWDPGRRISGRLFHSAAAVAVLLNPLWRVSVVGRRPAGSDHPFVAVCNHESLADVILVGSLPWEMKWLSKRAIARLPFVGWMMTLIGDIAVTRRDPESRQRAFEAMKDRITRGMSIMIFPEGTRSRTTDMLPFRNGAFRLAIETQVPVLPLVVSGTRDSIRSGSLLFNPADVTVRILEPIEVTGLSESDVESLRDRVQALIDSARRDGAAQGRATGTGS